MKTSPREQWLLALVAPVLVLAAGELAVLRPLRASVADLKREMTAKGSRAMWQAQLQQAHVEAGRVRDELEEVRTALAKSTAPLNHAAALKEVSRFCSEGGLSLLSSVQENSSALVQGLQSSIALLAEQNGGVQPEAWKIEVRGSYAQVRRLLDACTAADPLIVPLHFGMKADEEGLQAATWTLTLWL